jgi:fumarate hydratase subunit beta
MRETGCVYLAAVGGAAALLSQGVKKVAGVFWLKENGEAEAVWQLQVKDFGPLIVAIDAHGKNLFTENENRIKEKIQAK